MDHEARDRVDQTRRVLEETRRVHEAGRDGASTEWLTAAESLLRRCERRYRDAVRQAAGIDDGLRNRREDGDDDPGWRLPEQDRR